MSAKKSSLEKASGEGRREIVAAVVMAGKGNADTTAVDSFLGKIFKWYSHRDPENHQNNIF